MLFSADKRLIGITATCFNGLPDKEPPCTITFFLKEHSNPFLMPLKVLPFEKDCDASGLPALPCEASRILVFKLKSPAPIKYEVIHYLFIRFILFQDTYHIKIVILQHYLYIFYILVRPFHILNDKSLAGEMSWRVLFENRNLMQSPSTEEEAQLQFSENLLDVWTFLNSHSDTQSIVPTIFVWQTC